MSKLSFGKGIKGMGQVIFTCGRRIEVEVTCEHMGACAGVEVGLEAGCTCMHMYFFFFFSTEGSPQPGSEADRARDRTK